MLVVTKKIIDENEARHMFQMLVHPKWYSPMPLTPSSFFQGCSTFLPVFDVNVDTFDAMHERSPFAVDAICMVAAMVRDGGGKLGILFSRQARSNVRQVVVATFTRSFSKKFKQSLVPPFSHLSRR